MIKQLTTKDIEYICHSMMGTNWLPSFVEIPRYLAKFYAERKNGETRQEAILRILSKCESKLEVMYFLGIGYYLHNNGIRNSTSDDYPSFWPSAHEGLEGIHVSEPFCGGVSGNGLSSLLVIPQYPSPEKPIHHDFGMFSAPDNGGGPPWYFFRAVEIEGYGVHKQRRKLDEGRYQGLSYKVVSIYEETTQPQDWYKVFDPDDDEY